jgi:RimJ/RimL family protein N-acetyltransferase
MQIEKVQKNFRRLSKTDFLEFKRAATESIESNMEYLYFGQFFDRANLIEMMNEYSYLLSDNRADHYGLFEGPRLLGHVAITFGQGPLGVEIYGWVRKGFQNKGIGELGLNTACALAFNHKGFNYATLFINQNNKPSRAVAEKIGFKPTYLTRSSSSPNAQTFIVFYKFSPKIEDLSIRYKVNPLDIMNCPATQYGSTYYLLKSESIQEMYRWPLPPFVEEYSYLHEWAMVDYLGIVNLTPEDLDSFRAGRLASN